jgi:tol-pal system protein YbgF
VDSQGSQPTRSSAGVAGRPASVPPSGSVSQSGAAELFTRLQQLEADVAELRGIVEEQNHQIEKLEAQQKEQYLDLDQRVALALKGQPAAATSSMPSTGGGAPGTGEGPRPTGSQGGNERDAYAAAFELTRQKRFGDAISAFNQMLVNYPKGQFSGNAFYWLGECYRALPEPDLEKSRQSFSQVISAYPTNQKVSDAMYKLGIVYHQLGDATKALEYLNRVQSQFPGTPAAQLARSYAAELH